MAKLKLLTEKEDDDAQELLGLDVRFVSGVGFPATGERFLLAKAGIEDDVVDELEPGEKDDDGKPKKKKKGAAQEAQTDAEQPAAKQEETHMDPVQDASVMQKIGRQLAAAFGVKLADDPIIKASENFLEAAKASGYAPADDAGSGSHPSYPKPKDTNLTGQAPSDDKGTPKIAKAGVDGTTVDQQPETIQGATAPQAPAKDSIIVQGKDVTASVSKSAVDELLAKLESQSGNTAAIEVARQALAEAFETPAPATDVNEDVVRDLVMKGLDPIITAVEALSAKFDTMQAEIAEFKTAKSSDARVDELESTVNEMVESLAAIQGRLSNAAGERAVRKSRVPRAEDSTVRKDAGVWAGSPFDVAASV